LVLTLPVRPSPRGGDQLAIGVDVERVQLEWEAGVRGLEHRARPQPREARRELGVAGVEPLEEDWVVDRELVELLISRGRQEEAVVEVVG
jgi:hypothetical protein